MGEGAGVYVRLRNGKKQRITDHGYKNSVFPNHEDKQVEYFFNDLFLQ